jgi:hypothetical protein
MAAEAEADIQQGETRAYQSVIVKAQLRVRHPAHAFLRRSAIFPLFLSTLRFYVSLSIFFVLRQLCSRLSLFPVHKQGLCADMPLVSFIVFQGISCHRSGSANPKL